MVFKYDYGDGVEFTLSELTEEANRFRKELEKLLDDCKIEWVGDFSICFKNRNVYLCFQYRVLENSTACVSGKVESVSYLIGENKQ